MNGEGKGKSELSRQTVHKTLLYPISQKSLLGPGTDSV